MISYGLRMIDIYTKLNIVYNKYIDCIYSDDNAEECIFRIRLTEYACKDIENKDEIDIFLNNEILININFNCL